MASPVFSSPLAQGIANRAGVKGSLRKVQAVKPAEKMSYAEFTRKAILTLREKPNKQGKTYKGIHVVYSGFNEALAKYYGFSSEEKKQACIDVVAQLERDGVIVRRFLMIYLPQDAPESTSKGDAALAAILG